MLEPAARSVLTIPNDPAFAEVAGAYVSAVAEKVGFDASDVSALKTGVTEAVNGLIDYSFDPGERADLQVACEPTPEGLRVTIRDEGLPLDPDFIDCGDDRTPAEGDDAKACSVLSRVHQYVDEVVFRNLGRAGKETVLIAYLRTSETADFYSAGELEIEPEPTGELPASVQPRRCSVRDFRSEDAMETARNVYKTYGYTYAYEHMYRPELLVELNRSGRVASLVATSEDGRIVGHVALMRWNPDSLIVEMGSGAVKPEYRGHGCFNELTAGALDKARSLNVMGVYGQAVTNHTFSQRTAHKFGFRDCAIFLGVIPSSVVFRGIRDRLEQRESLCVHFRYLDEPESVAIYPPARHADMVKRLYENLGARPTIVTETPEPEPEGNGDAIVETSSYRVLNAAKIEVRRSGAGVVEQVESALRDLRFKRIDQLTLWLNLHDPRTADLTEPLERLGFFFAGILPGGVEGGDAMILQYLNNVPLDFSKIRLVSDSANALLEYIRDMLGAPYRP